MIRPASPLLGLVAAAALAFAASSQDKAPPPPSSAPSPAEKNPIRGTTDPDPSSKPDGGTAMPVPEKSLAPPGAKPGAAPSGSSASASRQTLVPPPAEAGDVDAVTLPAKPAAILSGKTTKNNVVAELRAQFARIEEALAKAGIKPTGRPLAVFTSETEDGLQYEAMIPIEAAPAGNPPEAGGLRFGSTPSGKAYRFQHSGAYDGIATTYEVLSTYLEFKNLAVQEPSIEEYVSDLKDGSDDKLEINIYALAK